MKTNKKNKAAFWLLGWEASPNLERLTPEKAQSLGAKELGKVGWGQLLFNAAGLGERSGQFLSPLPGSLACVLR